MPLLHTRRAAAIVGLSGLVAAGGLRLTAGAPGAAVPGARTTVASPRALVEQYCLDCHDNGSKKSDLSLEAIMASDIATHASAWEKVVKKLRTRQMPPVGEPRPDDATYEAIVTSLETALDRAAAAHPNPGRTATIRRLTRTEYRNAIRDLLAVDVDVSALLPADESSYGFDNVTVGDLSPTLLERYLSAAETISRAAVGRVGHSPGGDTFRVAPDLTQEEHLDGLPLGTRGGTVVSYTFPQDGEYEISIRLRRDRDEKVEGLTEAHEVDVLLDRARVQSFTVQPQRPPATGQRVPEADAHLTTRLAVLAGPHVVGVTFPKKPSDLPETARQPYQAHFNSYRHPRLQPAIFSVSIVGPIVAGRPGDTPSRRRIFGSRPTRPAGEDRRGPSDPFDADAASLPTAGHRC